MIKVDVTLGRQIGAVFHMGNILWRGKWPMRHGKWPADHPAPDNVMKKFRERGYWASCFPEGDGITFRAEKDQGRALQLDDIRECFGFEVRQ